jgi:hypothetical protein
MTKMDMVLYGFVFIVVLVGVVGIIREIRK